MFSLASRGLARCLCACVMLLVSLWSTLALADEDGACCYVDPQFGVMFCTQLEELQCIGLDGFWHGPGTSCNDVSCDVGACCYDVNGSDETCNMMTASDCLEKDGLFHGEGVPCSATDCWLGACCYIYDPQGFVCIQTNLDHCDALEGNFHGVGSSCDDVSCILGACCFEDVPYGFVCVQHTPSGCEFFSGTFHGYGVQCSDVECHETPYTPGDVNLDGAVDIEDLMSLLQYYGSDCDDANSDESDDGCWNHDADQDGAIGTGDLLIILANWG